MVYTRKYKIMQNRQNRGEHGKKNNKIGNAMSKRLSSHHENENYTVHWE